MGRVPRRPDPLDERPDHPDAATVARPRRGEPNDFQDDIRARRQLVGRITAHASTDDSGMEGRARSGARANLLMGVTSNPRGCPPSRARAERALEQLRNHCRLYQPPRVGRAPCSTRRGSTSFATRPTTRSVRARPTRCATAVLHRYRRGDADRRRTGARAGGARGKCSVDGPVM